ncbi:MAG: Cna B-type domain-containing protein [Oscillospiraceae bacterium]|nr:Cna B-type domain-containing protein [Oscillospiraceae bacterium]
MPATYRRRRLLRALTAVLLLLLPMQFSRKAAAAAEKSITLICCQDDTILTGMEWSLYRIGVRRGTAIDFIPELSEYSMDLGDLSAKTVDTAAKTIESYVTAAGLSALKQGKTDTAGKLTFSGLDNGLYLAAGKTLQIENTVYYPSTLLLEINNADAALDYDAYPKFYYTSLSEQMREFSVRKIWVDDNNAYGKRPVSLTVDLYRDGKLNQSVSLDAANNWTFSWSAPDDGTEWTAVERDVPESYSVMIDYNSKEFLIRNTYTETTTVTETETTTVTTVTETETSPTEPETTTTVPKLVQTGQLWWPVIPLSIGGVILIAAGISMRTRKKKDEE